MLPVPDSTAELRSGLSSALYESLDPLRRAGVPLGILFSGGVDSSLLAWELRETPGLVLCTLGREGSSDLESGRVGAQQLGLPWQGLRAGEEEVKAAASRFEGPVAGLSSVARTVLLTLAVAIVQARPRRLVCGQGADELFLGYAHYRGLGPDEARRRSDEDLERLRSVDWPRTRQIAIACGKDIEAPFLSPAFEQSVRRIPIELRLPADLPKRFLREWAVERGLPAALAYRPKKAVQYGTGVAGLLRGMRRSAH